MLRPALLIATLALGCNSASRAAPPPEDVAPPVTASSAWSGNVLRITGGECQPCAVRFAIGRAVGATEPQLAVALEDGLGDIKVRFRGEVRTVSRKRAVVALPPSLFGDMNLKTGLVQLDEPVQIEVAHVTPFAVTIPAQRYGAALLFVDAPPVAFAGEDSSTPATARTAWTMLADRGPAVLGPGVVARDVAWLITEQRVDAGSRRCTGYRDTRTGEARDVTAIGQDSVLTIRDRRTGEVVKTETLKGPPPECPSLQVGWTAAATSVPRARVDAWVRRAMQAP
ncbi:MAG: hypothetical protein K8W52_45010 [Deltaproteobacteria bacterium]|nr:hypothetical protein [Deltaproteobacteria bacterium]